MLTILELLAMLLIVYLLSVVTRSADRDAKMVGALALLYLLFYVAGVSYLAAHR